MRDRRPRRHHARVARPRASRARVNARSADVRAASSPKVSVKTARPSTTAEQRKAPSASRRPPDLSRSGFISTRGASRHACACTACAVPISPHASGAAPPPSSSGVMSAGVALFDMFWALNGAGRAPLARTRHSPAAIVLARVEPVPKTQSEGQSAVGASGAITSGGRSRRNCVIWAKF